MKTARGHLSLETLLDTPALQEYLGRSLMIEGGSSIISGFLPSPKVDLVVATVAPIYVGDGVDLIRPGVCFFPILHSFLRSSESDSSIESLLF